MVFVQLDSYSKVEILSEFSGLEETQNTSLQILDSKYPWTFTDDWRTQFASEFPSNKRTTSL